MCYYVASHFSIEISHQLEHDFVLRWEEEERPEPYFAVSGFQHPLLPVITDQKEFKRMRWGLIPPWVKDWEKAMEMREYTLNAVGDTIDSKPSFRGAVKAGQYCVIPVNGFYEWHHHENKKKYPHYIYPTEYPVFLLAGLYEQWHNPAIEEVHNTFTIVTTNANSRMEWIHNSKKRMPAILTVEGAKAWLDKEISKDEKRKLLEPFDVALMRDHSVSTLITSRKESSNQPQVMEPCVYPELTL